MKIYFAAHVKESVRRPAFRLPSFSMQPREIAALTDDGKVFHRKLETGSSYWQVIAEFAAFMEPERFSEEPITIVVEKPNSYEALRLMLMLDGIDREWDYDLIIIKQSLNEYMDLLQDDELENPALYTFRATKLNEEGYTRTEKLEMFKSHRGYPKQKMEPDLQDKVLHLQRVEQFLCSQRDRQITYLKFAGSDEDDNS